MDHSSTSAKARAGAGNGPGNFTTADFVMDYSLHSIRLSSNYPFPVLSPAVEPAPTIRFQLVAAPLPAPPASAVDLGTHAGPEGQGAISLQRDNLTFWFQSPTVGRFVVAPGEAGIRCSAPAGFNPGHLQHQVLRIALSLALHQRGIVNLHASAVHLAATGRAVGLLGHPGQGKSTLTAALVRRGHPLLGDDLLVISGSPAAVLAHPGLRYIRLCPDTYEWLGIPLARAAPGEKLVATAMQLGGVPEDRPLPLSALALIERRPEEEQAQLERLSLGDALLALLAHTSFRYFLPAPTLKHLMAYYACLLEQLPVYRLTYPDRWEGLAMAEQALLEAPSAAPLFARS